MAAIEAYRALFIAEDDLEMIGTGAIEPGDDEWCLGIDAASDLVQNDWEGWGDVVLDVADARIHVLGDVAWLATTGTVTMDLDPNETVRDYLSYMQEVAGDVKGFPRSELPFAVLPQAGIARYERRGEAVQSMVATCKCTPSRATDSKSDKRLSEKSAAAPRNAGFP